MATNSTTCDSNPSRGYHKQGWRFFMEIAEPTLEPLFSFEDDDTEIIIEKKPKPLTCCDYLFYMFRVEGQVADQ
jgi:hypothetical protein